MTDKSGINEFDAVVAGGGPAGIAAAITAARAGARVLLLERGRYPRQKVCGEFISAESLDLLRSLLREVSSAAEKLAQAPRIERARVFGGAQKFEARIVPASASLARYDLDAMLWSAAEAAGVEARQNAEVLSCERMHALYQDGSGQRYSIRLRSPQGMNEIRAATVVNAAGRSSRLSPQAVGDKWIGLKAHFHVAADVVAASTDLYCFSGGYCGVQPVHRAGKTLVNVCALVRAERARTVQEVLACDRRLRETSRGWVQVCETVTTGAVAFHPAATERNGMFLVGDAAGFIDPFVGDGIAIALRSGNMAGEIASRVARGEMDLDAGHREYAERYHAAFDGAFRNARRLRRMLELPAIPRAALIALLKIPGAAEMVVRATRSA
jgi:flavin-dependent dehydrogenase